MTKESPLASNKMGTMPIGKLLINMALPIIISMLVQALYNIVDSMFVAQISPNAVTALGLAFPIQNVQIGFATGIGVGVNALLSKSLGEGDQQAANRAAGNGIFLVGVATVLFMLFGIFGARPYFAMQSQDALTVQYGTEYASICCILTLGVFAQVLGERLLQATGRTFLTMITQGTGAIINIVLDWFFIFGVEYLGLPSMGIAGAALATVIGQWIAAIMNFVFTVKYNPDVQLSLKSILPRKEILKPILVVGIPSIIMMCISSVMNFSMNQILQGLDSTETATGVFGIYYKLQSFFFMPLFGINNATISIIAFNYGARQPKRITGTLKISCITAFSIMMLGFLAFQFAPELLLGIFNPTDEFLRIGKAALRIISIHFPIAAVGIALGASFQAMGNGIYATITSLCRQMFALLPAAYLLSLAGEVNRVWWSFPIAEVVSLTVSVILFARIYRQKIKPLF